MPGVAGVRGLGPAARGRAREPATRRASRAGCWTTEHVLVERRVADGAAALPAARADVEDADRAVAAIARVLRLTDSSRRGSARRMAPVRDAAPRAPRRAGCRRRVALVHVNGDGGAWELLVSGARRRWRRSLAILLAQREAATVAGAHRAATGTVPYSGRLHPDGSWRGHVAGPGAARMLGAPYSAAAWARGACTRTTPRRSPRPASAPRAASRARSSTGSSGPTARRARSGTGCAVPGGTVAGVRVDVTERRATERQLSSARARRLESVLRQLDDERRDARGARPTALVAVDAARAGRRRRRRAAARGARPPGRPRRTSTALDAIRRGERVAIGIRQVADDGAACAGCGCAASRAGAGRPAVRRRDRQRRHRPAPS